MPTVFEQPLEATKSGHSHTRHGHGGKHNRMTLFTSYAEHPMGVKFETQHDNEEVVIFMRQHFIVNVPWVAATILLILAPFGILPFLFRIIPGGITLPPSYYIVGSLFWYLVVFGYFLVNFIRWYYNIYIVTTERVIDIDFIQLLYKKFSEARLNRIEDVSYVASGFTATIFNFGTISIQTAGENTNFEFDAIPNPAAVVKRIGEMIKQNQH